MSSIPLDIQRRCEQRWAARFSQTTASVADRKRRPDSEIQPPSSPATTGDEEKPTEDHG